MDHKQKNDIPMHLGQVLKWQKILVSNFFYHFLVPFHLAIWASKVSKKFRLGRKIGFQNTFYIKCINVIIDSIGPSIILRSICSNFGVSHNILIESIILSFYVEIARRIVVNTVQKFKGLDVDTLWWDVEIQDKTQPDFQVQKLWN